MPALQEDGVDLPTEAYVAVVEGLFFLPQQRRELLDLLLQQDDLLAQERVVFPLHLCLAAAVHALHRTKENEVIEIVKDVMMQG